MELKRQKSEKNLHAHSTREKMMEDLEKEQVREAYVPLYDTACLHTWMHEYSGFVFYVVCAHEIFVFKKMNLLSWSSRKSLRRSGQRETGKNIITTPASIVVVCEQDSIHVSTACRREKRVDSWRGFQEDPAAKKARLASYKEEVRDTGKFGQVKLETWKKAWK
jgi:hypothetical protein